MSVAEVAGMARTACFPIDRATSSVGRILEHGGENLQRICRETHASVRVFESSNGSDISRFIA